MNYLRQPAFGREQNLPRVSTDQEVRPKWDDDQQKRDCFKSRWKPGNEERQRHSGEDAKERCRRTHGHTAQQDHRIERVETEQAETGEPLVILQRERQLHFAVVTAREKTHATNQCERNEEKD